MLNGKNEDCWKLEITYDTAANTRAIFYISKQTHDILKMEEWIGKNRKRYKVKLGVAV